jgi:hypothetical protein
MPKAIANAATRIEAARVAAAQVDLVGDSFEIRIGSCT